MKIIVIGSSGFIGSHCIKYFNQKGFKVFAAPHVLNFDDLFQQNTFDVCINASGSANVGLSFENPVKDFELNVVNVHKILTAIRSFNPDCKLLNFSSASVYGNPACLPVKESAKLAPLSPYGFHKLQSEYLLTEYHRFFGIKTCNLRVFSAYGTGLKKQLFWDLFQKSKKNTRIEIFGTGEESRDFIFIDDLLTVIDLIIQNGKFNGDCINVASGIEIKIKDAVRIFYGLFDAEIDYFFSGKEKIGDPKNWLADIQQIKKMGFSPQFSIETGLKQYIKWLKNCD